MRLDILSRLISTEALMNIKKFDYSSKRKHENMTEKSENPEWVDTLIELMTSMYDWKAPAYIDWIYSMADENDWGVDLIELYPALQELEGAGPNDGEIVYARVNSFDILEAQKVFDSMDSVSIGFEKDELPVINFEGKYKGHFIIVRVRFDPLSDFEEDEAE